jgi:Xaa-Pro aminopeptidase
LSAVRQKLVDMAIDGLLVSSLPNVRYLTGFSGSSALLLVAHADALLLSDFRYETQIVEEVGSVCAARIEPSSLWTGLWESLRERRGIQVVAFESQHLVHRDFQRLLDEGSAWTWRPTVDVVESFRVSKDAAEVASVTRAAAIATTALEHALCAVRPGMTELQVAGLLERDLRDAGTEAFPFATIVASGSRTARPHARAGSRPIASGDFLLLDFGAVADGYCADVTRTVVVGRATDRQRAVYDAVLAANEAARTRVRAGMTGVEADAIARDVLTIRGFGSAFGHGLGHGLGLEVHEAPRLSRFSESVLPVGAVVTIEPGVYLPEWGGVRIEDDVFLGPAGPELLTHFRRELTELG